MENSSLRQPPEIVMVDSINYLMPEHAGMTVLAGSHGGLYSAYKALSLGVRSVILNDAGVGLDEAGIASLAYGDAAGLPVAAIAHSSARIGDAGDMRRRGRISHANRAAAVLGVQAGMACDDALERLHAAGPAAASAATVAEHRHEQPLLGRRIVCIDSASLIKPEDRGGIVVTGSHGGLIGGDAAKAMNVAVRFAAFNDAGVGTDAAGIGRLEPLDRLGIAAVTVAHHSARIGDALSTYEQGVISHVNVHADALGFRPGARLAACLWQWLATDRAAALTEGEA
ncbi:hypothetical protein ACFO0J_01040 [Castellaniella hirudinis]|uniref:Uncharacterized protein n=1 Tax=Castellaniella hirudinis TaxID=1144617 RepID=A0ABV8RTW9_9BURK